MKIIIFDSGVGGFSILKLLLKLPHKYLYLADQAYFPYGNKSESEINSRIQTLSSWFRAQNPDLVVMACNTATVSGIEMLRQTLPCPVVGIEPVVKPAAKFRKSLLLGTNVTINSNRIKELLITHPSNIVSYTPQGLASAIECNKINQVKTIIKKIKNIVQSENITAIGLSCTHYPLVRDLFKQIIPNVSIIDPTQAVADQVISIISSSKSTHSKHVCDFYTTGDMLRFNYQIRNFLDLPVKSRKVVI